MKLYTFCPRLNKRKAIAEISQFDDEDAETFVLNDVMVGSIAIFN